MHEAPGNLGAFDRDLNHTLEPLPPAPGQMICRPDLTKRNRVRHRRLIPDVTVGLSGLVRRAWFTFGSRHSLAADTRERRRDGGDGRIEPDETPEASTSPERCTVSSERTCESSRRMTCTLGNQTG